MENNQKRGTEFIKNTIILFIGKFATQFISLLLLPLYTHYLLREDYGLVDLFQTYINLFVPILTLRLDTAVFRFLIDKRKNKNGAKVIITNSMIILLVSILITIIIGFLSLFFIKTKYFNYVIINIIVLMISNIMLQVLRGFGKTKQYSIASIITGASTLIINVFLIIFCKFGANSILISSIISNVICIFYICININIIGYIDKKVVSKNQIKDILKYSLPMIPNSLSWWIVNVSDRTLISIFLGVTFNGIYTVSCKFSNILNSIYSIFNMSWQETASLHIDDKDKDVFFSNMVNKIFMLFSIISLLIVSIIPLFYTIIIGSNYYSSYNYIPILLYANSWNVLISLIGGIYIAKKRTREIANTTIASAIINLVINLLLINFIGLYAAAISTLISYFIMAIYRFFDCQKYVLLKLEIKKIVLYTIIYLISSFFYSLNNKLLCIINLIFVLLYSILSNKDTIKDLLKFLSNKKKGIKKDILRTKSSS